MPHKNQTTGNPSTLFGRGETWKALNRIALFNRLNDTVDDPLRLEDSESLAKLSLSKEYRHELNLLSLAARLTPMKTGNWELLDQLEQAVLRLSRSANILNAELPLVDEVIFPYLDYLLLRMRLKTISGLIRNLDTHLNPHACNQNLWLSSGILYYKASIARHQGQYPLACKYYQAAIQPEVRSGLSAIRLAKCYAGLALIQLLGNDNPGKDVKSLLQKSVSYYTVGYGGKKEGCVLAKLPLLDYYEKRSETKEYSELINDICKLRDWKKNADLFHAILLVKLAQTFSWRSEHAKAEVLLNESLHITRTSLGPEHPITIETLHSLSRTLINLGKPHLAETYLQSALQYSNNVFNRQHHNFYNIPGSLAKCYLNKLDAEKALSIIKEKLEKLHNYKYAGLQDFNEAVLRLLNFYKEKGNYADAIPVIDKYLQCLEKRRSPEEGIYTSLLEHQIWALRRQKKFIAVKEIKHELAISLAAEEEMKAMNNKLYDFNALAMKMKNNFYEYDLSEEYYKQALTRSPACETYLSNYALFLVSIRKDYKNGEEYYKRALGVNRRCSSTLANYAFYLYTVKGDFQGADLHFQQALKILPDAPNYLNNLAGLRLVQDRFDEACFLNNKAYDPYSFVNDQVRLRILFMRILLQMKQGKSCEEPLGIFKYCVEEGSIHSAWHNPVVMDYYRREFSGPELQLLEQLYHSVSDEACLEELYNLPVWNRFDPLDPMTYRNVPF